MNELRAIVGMTFAGVFRGRRLAVAILLATAPLALAALVLMLRARFAISGLSPGALYRYLLPGYYHTFLILTAMLFATSATSDDEEDGSVVYLLVRPVRRGIVYLGKIAAAAAATALVVLASLGLTFATLRLGGGGRGPALATLLQDLAWLVPGAVAYCAAFAAVSTLFRRPLLAASGLLFLWEIPFAAAPTSLRGLTVSHYLLSLMPHGSPWNIAVAQFGLGAPAPRAALGIAALVIAYLVVGTARYERREHLPLGTGT